MDKGTIEILEDIRSRGPRYLFRAWNNTPPEDASVGRLSGGHEGLNTTQAITPLAYLNGGGRNSVYELTKQEFTDMAIAHLTGRSDPETQLSSWASSLAFALNNVAWAQLGGHASSDALESIHVSIVDTKELWNDVQVFYVPLLDFLKPNEFNFPHEYLAHGVIDGPAHKALPLKVFHDVITIGSGFGPTMNVDDGIKTKQIVAESLQKARQIGDQYGGDFALPMCLALLCRKKRDPQLFREGFNRKELDLIWNSISDLAIPQKWSNDKSIQHDAEFAPGYGDVEQFCRLMRALLDRSDGYGQLKLVNVDGQLGLSDKKPRQASPNDNHDHNTSKYANAAQARAAKRVTAKRRSQRIVEIREKQQQRDGNLDEKDEKAMQRLQRALKKLKIDMKAL